MALLDGLLGALTGAMGARGPQAANPMMDILLQMMAGGRGPSGGGLGGGLGGAQGNPLSEILSQLGGRAGGQAMPGGGAAPQMGGLGDLIQAFQRNGMGEKMDSWIGTGQNQPISVSEIERAMGIDSIGAIAKQAGVQPQEAASGMAAVLPELINRLTPQGQVPQGGVGDINSILEMLRRQS